MDNYLNLIEKNYTNDELIRIINDKNSDDFLRIFSVISLTIPLNREQFDVLSENLINNSTPVREVVSQKLEEINEYNPEYFNDKEIEKIILKAIIDINPNVSRAICSIIEKNRYLKNSLEKEIIRRIELLLYEIKDFQNNEKNHAKNKKIFSLYWLLESLSITISQKNNDKILNLVTICLNFANYTIREKGAKILTKIKNCPPELTKKVIEDENFYVKNQVYDKITMK